MMKINIILILTLLFAPGIIVVAQKQPDVSLIPVPVTLIQGEGVYNLSNLKSISFPEKEEEVKWIAEYFVEKIKPATGLNIGLNESLSQTGSTFELILNQKIDEKIDEEGYQLKITPKQIVLSANKPAGLFYGIQTLLQLLPKEIGNDTLVNEVKWSIPAVEITDYPRFAWRGLMLDVSRHFFSKEVVKEYIDQMASYKYNRFHWHLTDDNGWRIEIKSLPKLTEVGAWRVQRNGTWGKNEPPKPGEKAIDGGFYTQDDIKEIIQYARDRYIEVLPEIDVPGHSMAAIAAYPELSVTKDSSIKVNPGTNFATWHGNGKFTMHIDNTLNPSDEKVYDFLDKVFTEVAGLFPFEYIHMGGDECYRGYWEKDPACIALMKKMNMKSSIELQSYFNSRVAKIIMSKGKKMIGWDEILEGGLPPGAAVMSWQGMKGGIEAAHQKANVVMSPAPMAYLDLYQGDPSVEPPTYSMARLKDSYSWDPVPEGVDAKYILGGQGNLWTEHISNKPQIDYMAYPRAFALSEIYWSPKANKNWEDFVGRVEDHFKRFDEDKRHYSTSMYDPIISVKKDKAGNVVIELTTQFEGLDIFYTLDQTIPNKYLPKYTKPIVLPADTQYFRVVTYRNGEKLGNLISLNREDLVKRIKK